MEGPKPQPEPVNISSSDSDDDDSLRQAKRVCPENPMVDAVKVEAVKVEAGPSLDLSIKVEGDGPSLGLSIKVEGAEPTLDLSPEEALLHKAQVYQEFMKTIPLPIERGSLILFKSWTGLGTSMKALYKQPFHYLTNMHLKQLDKLRIGAEDEETPLDFIMHPVKAEAMIWLVEECHRKVASPHHLAKMWLSDPMYHMYIDPALPGPVGSSSAGVVAP